MNKKTKKELFEYLSKTFDASNFIEYKYIEFENDDDINFLITPKLADLAENENNKFRLILYCSDKTTLSIYCPRLYSLNDHDSAIYTLNAINTVNSKIAIGKVYLNKDNSSVISYINRVFFNDITKEFTIGLLKNYITSFLATSIEFYEQMKVKYD